MFKIKLLKNKPIKHLTIKAHDIKTYNNQTLWAHVLKVMIKNPCQNQRSWEIKPMTHTTFVTTTTSKCNTNKPSIKALQIFVKFTTNHVLQTCVHKRFFNLQCVHLKVLWVFCTIQKFIKDIQDKSSLILQTLNAVSNIFPKNLSKFIMKSVF